MQRLAQRVIGVIFVRLYQVSSAYAVRFSVSGDTKAVNSRHFVAVVAAASPNVNNENEILKKSDPEDYMLIHLSFLHRESMSWLKC